MIRFAEEKDAGAIMQFIDEYWQKNHIMSRNRQLFDFQHKWGEELSFVLSEKEGEITGVLGYIPYGRKERDVTLAIWKTDKTEETMQGINILSYLRKNGGVRTVSAPGINPKTIPIYKFLGLNTGKMKQWYRLSNVHEYKIASVHNKSVPIALNEKNLEVAEFEDFTCLEEDFGIEDILIRKGQPFKSREYLRRRYFEHPIFLYKKYGVKLADRKLLLILRVQKCNSSAALRMIDCIGDHELLSYFTPKLDELLEDNHCEYADCFETGIADRVFQQGGWLPVEDSGNIIPDHFAPYEQKNISIYYMSEISGAILLKGDGDMDRPNE